MKKFVRYYIPVLLWMGVIFSFSEFPTKQAGGIYWVDFIIKKTAHVVEYGILTILSYRAFLSKNVKHRNAALWAILISVLYGVSDEFHQGFTPGREPHIRDVFFDTIGSLLAIYGVWNWIPKIPKIKRLAEKFEII